MSRWMLPKYMPKQSRPDIFSREQRLLMLLSCFPYGKKL